MWFWILIQSISWAEVPKKLPKDPVRGQELYDELCFQCHGAKALGENPVGIAMKAPPLAGQISKEDYDRAIVIIQEGQGMMPAYEMLIDKHDSKKILMYLSQLDPVTGENPLAEPEEEIDQDEIEKDNLVDPLRQKILPISTQKINTQKVQQAAEVMQDANDENSEAIEEPVEDENDD